MSNLSEQQEKFFKALLELNKDIHETNEPIIFTHDSKEIAKSNVKN